MGSLSGLRILHYLSNDKEAKNTVIAAFENFYNEVSNSLTKDEQRNMGWNTIVAEHLLCKVTRIFGNEA